MTRSCQKREQKTDILRKCGRYLGVLASLESVNVFRAVPNGKVSRTIIASETASEPRRMAMIVSEDRRNGEGYHFEPR